MNVRDYDQYTCQVVLYDVESRNYRLRKFPLNNNHHLLRKCDGRMKFSLLNKARMGYPLGCGSGESCALGVTLFRSSETNGTTHYVISRRYVYDTNVGKFRLCNKIYVYVFPGSACFDPGSKRCELCEMLDSDQNVVFVPVGKSKDVWNDANFRSCLNICCSSSANPFNIGKLGVYCAGRMKPIEGNFDALASAKDIPGDFLFMLAKFVEEERMLLKNFPLYYEVCRFAYFPMELFLQGAPVRKAVEYLLMQECLRLERSFPEGSASKQKILLKDYIRVTLLNKPPDPEYFPESSCILKDGMLLVLGKLFREVDIFSSYPSGFMNIYEGGNLNEFGPLYECVKRLLSIRSTSGRNSRVWKRVLNAGCYGCLNMRNFMFGTQPQLMKSIVQNVYSAMIQSEKILDSMGYMILYSKNDSHFIVRKTKSEIDEELFAKHVNILNSSLCEMGFPNTKFVYKGAYRYGLWLNDKSSYILQKCEKFNSKTDKLRGTPFNSLSLPLVIRNFAISSVNKYFKTQMEMNFRREYENYRSKCRKDPTAFFFKKKSELSIFAEGSSKDPCTLRRACEESRSIDTNGTFNFFRRRINRKIGKPPLFL